MELQLSEELGTRLSDGHRAADFRMQRISPYVDLCEKIVLDFTDVRIANSSFVNALVSGSIEQHGEAILQKMAFRGCSPAIKVLVEAAVFLGISKTQNKVA
ncbi:MAG: STAS-like domain-containing protein [Prosthecobacter sp.]|nr:STAS-like domain-containing protein [Prosthecobacter sp.]